MDVPENGDNVSRISTSTSVMLPTPCDGQRALWEAHLWVHQVTSFLDSDELTADWNARDTKYRVLCLESTPANSMLALSWYFLKGFPGTSGCIWRHICRNRKPLRRTAFCSLLEDQFRRKARTESLFSDGVMACMEPKPDGSAVIWKLRKVGDSGMASAAGY